MIALMVLRRLILPILVFGGLAFVFFQKDAIYDWWRLRNYNPPAAISRLTDRAGFTDKAKHLFYINHPKLVSSKKSFQAACTQTEQTIVLGCYISPQLGITIYDVKDKRLNGVEEVTAAHEMLHAAYDRLSDKNRDKINKALNDYFKQELTDPRVKATIKSYQKTEPDDWVNEMHSVFATEIAYLPSSLESHFQQYFKNRGQVVKLSERYEDAFRSREAKARQLLKQLKNLESDISAVEADLKAEQADLSADRRSIDSQSEADAFNQRIQAYNAKVAHINSLVDRYNKLRLQYNELVLQSRELFNAINTKSVESQSTQ